MIRLMCLLMVMISSAPLFAQGPAFGQAEDTATAAALWQQMLAQNLVGDQLKPAELYKGVQPHGLVLENLVSEAVLGDHKGMLVVKRNYGPKGIDEATVANNRWAALKAITIMFSREAGYDPDNQNWFYAKYLPNGSLDKNPKGVSLAGCVAKGAGPNGADGGCIACHRAAPGDDFLYVTALPEQ